MTVGALPGSVEIHGGDNLAVAAGFADGSFTLIYLDPPFNTGRVQGKALETARSSSRNKAEPAGPDGDPPQFRTPADTPGASSLN